MTLVNDEIGGANIGGSVTITWNERCPLGGNSLSMPAASQASIAGGDRRGDLIWRRMSRWRRQEQAHDDTVLEIQQAKAETLGRIGGMLETYLGSLAKLESEARAAMPEDRVVLERRYQKTRELALLYRWYLEIQREAIGLNDHRKLDAYYRIPGPMDSP